MKSSIRLRLSAMMFINFFIWGIWFVTMGTYLTMGKIGADGGQTGLAYGTQCLGAIIAPFIVGIIADRFVSAQKILGALHLMGAVIMYFISAQESFSSFYSLLLLYMIIYMPTLALVNSISLNQVSDAEKEFAGIRVFGTIGWIVAGLLIGYMAWEPAVELVKNGTVENASISAKEALKTGASNLSVTFLIASIISGFFGIFCFFLPNTPPPKAGKQISLSQILGLDALNILKDRNYLIFFIASVLICIPLAFYYGSANQFLNETGMSGAAAKMTLGQMSETLFLFLMPFFFKRFGVKQMLLIGMFAWVLRYILFAYGDMGSGIWMIYLGIILHGICYDFFFVTGQIYTDQKASDQVRSSAQGLITLATYGVGMYIGFWAAGKYADGNTIVDSAGKVVNHNWQAIWLFPGLFAAGVALLFLVFFRNEKVKLVAT